MYMILKQTIQRLAVAVLAVFSFAVFTTPTVVHAGKCGGVDTSIINCTQTNKGDKIENNAVWGLLLIAINIMTGLIGIVAVGGLVYGSVLYASAEDKSDQVNQAKQIITNIVIGLILFALMYSLLNFLIPGGIFA